MTVRSPSTKVRFVPPIRVLLVDDDESWVAIMRHFIKKAGPEYQLQSASRIAEALDLLYRDQVEVCIVDMRLGAESGLDLLIRHGAEVGSTAFLLMTGLVDAQTTEDAYRLGADLVLSKDDLTSAVVDQALRRAMRARATRDGR